MFRECSSRKIAFSPRGKFTPLHEIAGKVNSSRKKAGERHVYPLRPMFPKGRPVSPRYGMTFTRDNFTSPRGRLFSSKEKIVKPGKNLIFLKNGKNNKIARMVQGSLKNSLDLG